MIGTSLAAFVAFFVLPLTERSEKAVADEAKSVLERGRQPVVVVVVDDGRSAVVANQRSGSLSMLDLEAMRVERSQRTRSDAVVRPVCRKDER